MGFFSSNSGSILETMISFFKEDDWKFEQIEGKTILKMGFSSDNGNWNCYAQAREEHDQFVFYSMLTTNVPPNKRLQVADFLTRANYGMVIGNFEMDMSDGEIRFKTAIDVAGAGLTTEQVKRHVYINVLTMDKYLPGVMKVAFGEGDPAAAAAEIEG